MHTTPTAVPVIVTVTVTVWVIDPLVPVTWRENVPEEDPLTSNVAVPEPEILVGLRLAVMPGGTVTVNDTAPENPLMEVIVMVEVPDEPGEMAIVDGVADMEKSAVELTTVRVTVAV